MEFYLNTPIFLVHYYFPDPLNNANYKLKSSSLLLLITFEESIATEGEERYGLADSIDNVV